MSEITPFGRGLAHEATQDGIEVIMGEVVFELVEMGSPFQVVVRAKVIDIKSGETILVFQDQLVAVGNTINITPIALPVDKL